MTAASQPTHNCNWPGCPKRVPRAMWGCLPCWSKLPQRIRKKLNDAWNRGRGAHSTAHNLAMAEAQAWISAQK